MMKMLVSDYDETYYINDEDIEINKKYTDDFRKLNNIFVIATGRSYEDFNNKLNLYNFKYDYVILNHGATIVDEKGNILLNISMPDNIIKDIEKELQVEKSVKYFCCSGIESRVNFNHHDITKIHIKYNTEEEAKKIVEIINRKFKENVNAYYVTFNSVEIISNKTNKALAIYKIMSIKHINKENIYTVGDGYSDIEMIREFNGYCMDNSVDELKYYCKENKVESVSKLIEKIL